MVSYAQLTRISPVMVIAHAFGNLGMLERLYSKLRKMLTFNHGIKCQRM